MQLSLLDDAGNAAKPEGNDAATAGQKRAGSATGQVQWLRPYQSRIVQEALTSLRQGKSPLVEMATGTGKTRVASDIVKQLLKEPSARVLWFVHRIELVHQARQALAAAGLRDVGVELPDLFSYSERVVVASKDTVRTDKRIGRIKEHYDPFTHIVIDEAHHAAAATYLKITDAWPQSLRLGLSATPDRLDRRKLSIFDTVTTPYTIVAGIDDAYLVPVLAKRCQVKAVDISTVGVVAGDFARGELEAVVGSEAAILGAIRGLLEHASARPTIVFCPGVSSAKRALEILGRTVGMGRGRLVTGETESDLRAQAFRDFGKTYQFLFNVDVATEGTDLPLASCIAMLGPTRSRSKFVQWLGRGLRTLPGLAGDTAEQRRQWVAASGKPNCLVLDFVGVTGKHSVVTVADIAGGTEKATKKTKARIEAGEEFVDVFGAIQAENYREAASEAKRKAKRDKEEEKRRLIMGDAYVETTEARLIGLGGEPYGAEWQSASPSPGQVDEMVRLGIDPSKTETAAGARAAILSERQRRSLATPKQVEFVRKHYPGVDLATLTKSRATQLFLAKKHRWR